jgi:hypothetical protein
VEALTHNYQNLCGTDNIFAFLHTRLDRRAGAGGGAGSPEYDAA